MANPPRTPTYPEVIIDTNTILTTEQLDALKDALRIATEDCLKKISENGAYDQSHVNKIQRLSELNFLIQKKA